MRTVWRLLAVTAVTVGVGLVGVSAAQPPPGNSASASFTSAGQGTINIMATCQIPNPPPNNGVFWSVSVSASDQYGHSQNMTWGQGPSFSNPAVFTTSYGLNDDSLPQGVTSDTWTWQVTLSCNGTNSIIGSGSVTATGGESQGGGGSEGGTGGGGSGSAPPMFGSEGAVQAPPTSACVGNRGLLLVVRSFQNVSYKRITVYVKGKRVKRLNGLRSKAKIVLRHLPPGRFAVKLFLYSTSWTISGTRTYHRCTS